MVADPAALIAGLPPWLQWAASAALFVVTVLTSVWSVHRGYKAEKAKEPAASDHGDLLDSSPIKRAVAAFEALADNARLQTEAAKTSAAALVAMAKLVEDDFEERRVNREVDRRLAEIKRARDCPA